MAEQIGEARACFDQIEVPSEEPEEHDAHDEAEHRDEDHHTLRSVSPQIAVTRFDAC